MCFKGKYQQNDHETSLFLMLCGQNNDSYTQIKSHILAYSFNGELRSIRNEQQT